jgi:hypothetical protein
VKRKIWEAKRSKKNEYKIFGLNMRNGSKTNPISLCFALKRKKI